MRKKRKKWKRNLKDNGVGKIFKIYRIIYQEVFYDKKRIIQSQKNCFL